MTLSGSGGGPPERSVLPRAALLLVGLLVALALLVARQSDDSGPPSGSSATAGSAPSGGSCAASAALAPPCGAWWGAYVPPGPNGLAASVTAFEQRIGRRLDLVYTYHDMGTGTDGQLMDADEQSLGRTRLLMLSWESEVWGGSGSGGSTADRPLGWQRIASGAYDATVIDPQAARIKAYGKPVLLAFDQEMDDRTPADGSPADYVAAYRHLHDRFQQLGVTNVRWVWTVTGYLPRAAQMAASYPGDAYVDWIGYDQYNYYLCKSVPTWQSFADTQLPSYIWLRQHISATKPLLIAEYGTAADPSQPQRQQQWYEQVPQVVRQQLPGVRAVVQWDSSVPGPDCDLSVDSPAASAGYAAAGRDPYFHQPLP
ncbi:glycoside hydrolase family 26 protein [Streptacidiphilus sp. EB129]|uniref:glycoside hydrolase family 26 protein n=1 Tax=Streptacidiphilus sp. EB129 TaxID=3156262 RepID=UPI0035142EB2